MSTTGSDVSQFLNDDLYKRNEKLLTENDRLEADNRLLRDTILTTLQRLEAKVTELEQRIPALHTHVWSQAYIAPDGLYYKKCVDPACQVVRFN